MKRDRCQVLCRRSCAQGYLRSFGAWTLCLCLAACGARLHSATSPTSVAVQCPTGLLPVLPPNTTSWVFLRPRAIDQHPQLGSIVARVFDAASERALIRRVERTGCDVR